MQSKIISKQKKINHWQMPEILKSQEGKIGYILMWLVGVPIPLLLLIFLVRGCH